MTTILKYDVKSINIFKVSTSILYSKILSKITLFLIIILCVSLLLFNIVSGASTSSSYYVAVGGNNSDTGLSYDHAWATPSYAVKQIIAGDTIYLINGTWENELLDFSDKTGDFNKYLTLTNYNQGNVLLNNSQIKIYPSSNSYGYINLSNIKITGTGINPIRNTHDINIKNVEIYNTSSIGVYFVDVVNSSLIDSNIHDNGWNSVMIQANFRNSSGILIKNNSIHDNPGTSGYSGHNLIDLFNYGQAPWEVKDIQIIGNRVYNVTIDNLLFMHTSNYVLTMHNIYIADNVFYNSSNQGVRFDYLVDSLIENNIAHSSVYGFESTQLKGPNVTFKNNTVYNTIGENLYLGTPYSNVSIYLENNNVSSYRIVTGNFLIKNPINNQFIIRTSSGGNINMFYAYNKILSENGANYTYYYPDRSEYITKGNETVTITTYPMTARPTTSSATVTVNSFNTALPAGSVLASFTANTINNNNVAFTMSTLTPGKRYFVKVGGATVDSPVADYTGMIQFSHSTWPAGTFTVVEDASYVPSLSRGNAIGTSTYVSQDPLPGANLTLYYQNGTSYGQSVLSGSDGSFIFSNVPYGNYYVVVDKHLYRANTSLIFSINSTSINIGSIEAMCYDVNGDTKIDVLDLNMILQSFNVKTGASYPSVDVNGDGVVDINDVTLVAGQIGE